jgi:hypothetical protein
MVSHMTSPHCLEGKSPDVQLHLRNLELVVAFGGQLLQHQPRRSN